MEKEKLKVYISQMKDILPEKVSEDFFANYEDEMLENAEVVFSNNAFQVGLDDQTFYAFQFPGSMVITEYVDIIQNENTLSKNKTQRKVVNDDGNFSIHMIERNLLIEGLEKDGEKNATETVSAFDKCYDSQGKLLSEEYYVYEKQHLNGDVEGLLNTPLPNEEILTLNHKFKKEYKDDRNLSI